MNYYASDKLAGLLYGSFIADALALGTHWIYDQEELRRDFGRVTDFLDPREDSYHPSKKRGEQTHYGDQALTFLESIKSRGRFDVSGFAQDWSRMGDGYPDYFDQATKKKLKPETSQRSRSVEGHDPRASQKAADLSGVPPVRPKPVTVAAAWGEGHQCGPAFNERGHSAIAGRREPLPR